VHNTTLHVFQYTVSSNHSFNKSTFQGKFLQEVSKLIHGIKYVSAHFITSTPPCDWKGLNETGYKMHQLVLYITNDDTSVIKFFKGLF
jgi:hypothetical protein